MIMKFCKKCGSLLNLTKENNKIFLNYTKCEFKKEHDNSKMITKEKIKKENHGEWIAKNELGKPRLDFKYENCGNKSYKIIDIGIKYGDEDWIYLKECFAEIFSIYT